MSLKVRVSYTEPQELKAVIRLLKPIIRSCKVGKGEDGPHKRAYMSCDVAKNQEPEG